MSKQFEPLEMRHLMAAYVLPDYGAVPSQSLSLTSAAPIAASVTRASLLDRVEGIVRGIARYQDKNTGAIIDPFARREVQYSTPYFAYAASTLIADGRAPELLNPAIKAFDRASTCYANGRTCIPDEHGEFYLFPLAMAYKTLSRHVSAAKASTWLTRLKTPLNQVISGYDWNWRTYAMKGAWALYGVGAISRSTAVTFIEDSWKQSQSQRLTSNALRLYQDKTSTPDTMAYDYASRANMMFLLTAGYDGASAMAMKSTLLVGAKSGLYLLDPTGQAPSSGRSSNHVWNDIVAAVTFERAARIYAADGDVATAGQYQRAASLAVTSADRWGRRDGLYQVTKNRVDPAARRGYADYSFLTNYNGYMMLHLCELATERRQVFPQTPTPAEAGGYALKTCDDFDLAVATAGGTQVQATTEGQAAVNYSQFWAQLGITRISQAGWDSRLGAIAGEDASTGVAASLAPVLYEGGHWKRLSELPTRYAATFTPTFVSSQLTRVEIVYAPRAGQTGPTFTQSLEVTPDGILMSVVSTAKNIAVTLPIMVNDGAALQTSVGSTIASTAYVSRKGAGDSLNYILLDSRSTLIDLGYVVHGATGDLAPLLARRRGATGMSVFIYPRTASDPTADVVQQTLRRRGMTTTTSALASVIGTTYTGRYSAGGFGQKVDVNRDGVVDLVFGEATSYTVQLDSLGRATSVQTAVATTVTTAAGRSLQTLPFQTIRLIRT